MTYRAKNKIDVFSVRGTKSFEPIMTNVTSCSASLHNKEKNLSDGKEKNLSRCKKNFWVMETKKTWVLDMKKTLSKHVLR